jgi:hypothetical protein
MRRQYLTTVRVQPERAEAVNRRLPRTYFSTLSSIGFIGAANPTPMRISRQFDKSGFSEG